jgi:hypothetical protein
MMFYFARIILGLLNTTLVSGISISIDSITSVHICSHLFTSVRGSGWKAASNRVQ